ncbi:hypothetical protein [Pseudooceanicola onchidii]|uniref:hypothetical protein n=1 Tax=Pseudooceanicola onchidii TaxID=2562279 RepID=UPI0010AAAA3B|nr:hypothetical protein [Pseudooceanicola onchidii]
MSDMSNAPHGIALTDLPLDKTERDLLPILRHFLIALARPETHAWHLAYATASEKWGATVGLAMAHGLAEYLRAAAACRPDGFKVHDPLDIMQRHILTVDEAMLLMVLHYTRRDRTDQARVALESATHGRRDPRMIRAALAFAARHGVGADHQAVGGRPTLRVVA